MQTIFVTENFRNLNMSFTLDMSIGPCGKGWRNDFLDFEVLGKSVFAPK